MHTDLKFKALVVLGTTSLILSVLTSTRTGEAETPKNVEIEYEGQLLDEKRKPIAGIYPLEFMLYKGESDERSIWRETHWVAVDGGRYKVRLGSQSRIRRGLVPGGQKIFLAVNLKNGGELTRETILFPGDKSKNPEDVKKTRDKPKDKPKAIDKAPKNVPKAAKKARTQYKTESSFAEIADFARRAGEAENAEKLGGKTLEELEAEIEQLRTLLAEARSKNKDITIGADTSVLPRIGGTGGSAYLRECPPGYVVTGVRGSAGALVDSFQIICSPLK